MFHKLCTDRDPHRQAIECEMGTERHLSRSCPPIYSAISLYLAIWNETGKIRKSGLVSPPITFLSSFVRKPTAFPLTFTSGPKESAYALRSPAHRVLAYLVDLLVSLVGLISQVYPID